MADSKPHKPAPKKAQTREERMKSALKSNMARRKAQARARAGDKGTTGTAHPAPEKES
ncbi:hypothetical protein [Sulfitobacter sp. SK012]|uniref:hypothetical protein n=1 Tax=Sulfitobacter sp. SK012 TaxID=1389005 RepID=UPI001576FC41|nr:hypothetical protein [Sulfitobacter sp. SK012]